MTDSPTTDGDSHSTKSSFSDSEALGKDANNKKKKDGMSIGIIAALIGVCVVTIILIAIIIVMCRKR